MGRYRTELVGTWDYWVSVGRYWLVLGCTGSEQGGSGCQCNMLSENVLSTWYKPSNYSIFGEERSVDVQTDKKT